MYVVHTRHVFMVFFMIVKSVTTVKVLSQQLPWSDLWQKSEQISVFHCSCIDYRIKCRWHGVLPGPAHRPRAWLVLKKRRHDDFIVRALCSLTEETPLNTGTEQLAATTRRRLAMVHAHPTLTHQEELNRTGSTPPREEMRDRREIRA